MGFQARVQYVLTGTNAANIITTGDLDDTIIGGGGDDKITGGAGADELTGGDGSDDFIVVDEDHHAAGEIISGDGGTDRILFTATDGGTLILEAATSVEQARISDSSGGNATTGNQSIDASNVTAGIWLFGNNGNNTLTGNNQDNIIEGAGGNDRLIGHGGSDSIKGGTGDDTITGGAGADELTGGAGADQFNVDAGADDITDFGAGADKVDITAGATLAAAVTANYTAAAAGDIDNQAAAADAVFTVADDVDFDASAATDTTSGITITAAGNTAASTLVGTNKGDVITGGDGGDAITGGAGDDTIDGGAGADILSGGAGNDRLLLSKEAGATGAIDTLVGGAGNDVYVLDSIGYYDGTVRFIDEQGGGATDRLYLAGSVSFGQNVLVSNFDGIEQLEVVGSAVYFQSSHLTGRTIELVGGSGGVDSIVLYVNGSTDLSNLSVGGSWEAQDFVKIEGKALVDDTIVGSAANDRIVDTAGGAGRSNSFYGNAGDDTISVGAGSDTISGGSGADTITLVVDATMDVISISRSESADGSEDQIQGFEIGHDRIILTGDHQATSIDLSNLTVASGEYQLGDDDVIIYSDAGTTALTATDLTANIQLGTATDAYVTTGNVVGGDFNDFISGGAGDQVITGSAGVDELTGGAGNDLFSLTGITSSADRDVVKDFSVSDDKLGLDVDFTGANTAANANAVLTSHGYTLKAGGNTPGQDYRMELSQSDQDIIELTGLNVGDGDLSLATDGSELLKMFRTNEGNTVGSVASLEFTNGGPVNTYLVAYDNGKAYQYLVSSIDEFVQANEISLVATLDTIVTDTLSANNFLMVV